MAIRKPSKPKFVKLPKQPKANASAEAWKNYDNKVKSAEAENDKRIAEYKRQVAKYEAELKQRDAIKSRAAKAKSKLSGF